MFQTLDSSEEQLTEVGIVHQSVGGSQWQATFTMQEMMELAMLHAKQMQVMHQQHKADLEILQRVHE